MRTKILSQHKDIKPKCKKWSLGVCANCLNQTCKLQLLYEFKKKLMKCKISKITKGMLPEMHTLVWLTPVNIFWKVCPKNYLPEDVIITKTCRDISGHVVVHKVWCKRDLIGRKDIKQNSVTIYVTRILHKCYCTRAGYSKNE